MPHAYSDPFDPVVCAYICRINADTLTLSPLFSSPTTSIRSSERHMILSEQSPVIRRGLCPAVLTDGHLNTFLSCCYGHREKMKSTLVTCTANKGGERRQKGKMNKNKWMLMYKNVENLTQSVFLFSLGSLFGIKVPDCDGIAVRHRRGKSEAFYP